MKTPTINEIQTQILDTAAASADLPVMEVLTENEQSSIANLTSKSKVSPWRLNIFINASIIWSAYKLFETLIKDIEERLAAAIPFGRGWWIKTALNYREGHVLPETGIYNDDGYTLPQIIESNIIAKAALLETIISGHGILRIKVAKSDGAGGLTNLEVNELAGFREYVRLKGAAGITSETYSLPADELKTHFRIHFNPLILDNLGRRRDGTNDTPLQDALVAFLLDKNNNDFNGELSLGKLTNILEETEGVEDPFLINAWSRHGGLDYDVANPIIEYIKPFSGYFKMDLNESVFELIPKTND